MPSPPACFLPSNMIKLSPYPRLPPSSSCMRACPLQSRQPYTLRGTDSRVSQNTLTASRRRRSTSSAYVCSDHDATYTCKRVWSAVELAGGSDLMRICLCRCSLLSTSISHFAFLGLANFVCRKGNCFLCLLVQGCASGEHGHHLLMSSLL